MVTLRSRGTGSARGSPWAVFFVWVGMALVSLPGSAQDYLLYRANLHCHTKMSDGKVFSEPQEVYDHARTHQLLDAVAVTDHGEQLDPDEWDLSGSQQVDDGSFGGIRGFEYTNNDAGHANVWGSQDWVGAQKGAGLRDDQVKETREEFFAWVAANQFAGDQVEQILCQFNHPTYNGSSGRDNYGGFFFDRDDPLYRTLDECFQSIELVSGWVPSPFDLITEKIEDNEPWYVQALLNGWHLGPSGNGDNHLDELTHPQRTGIYAASLDKAGIFEALQARRTFAAENESLELVFRARRTEGDDTDWHWMGEIITTPVQEGLEFYVRVATSEEEVIQQVHIMSVQQEETVVVESWSPGSSSSETWHPIPLSTLEEYSRNPWGECFFYVKAEQKDGEGIISAPIWIKIPRIYVSPTGDDEAGDGSRNRPFQTLQKGIDRAEDGYAVEAAPGIYRENLVWDSKSLLLRGAGIGQTIVEGDRDGDGGGDGSCLILTNVPDSASIEGVTFRNGEAEKGAGLFLDQSPITVAYSEITGNSAEKEGGGLYLEDSAATLHHNTISGNRAGSGGGVYLSHSAANLAQNILTGNTATFNGGGLYLDHSPATGANNWIVGNTAGEEGGGVFAAESNATLIHNTIADNAGEGVMVTASDPTVTNSILWNNGGTGDLVGVSATYSDIGTGETEGPGNISQDPRFVAADDYHLQESSPCINKGNNDAPDLPSADIDGDPRLMEGTVDMGADETGLPLQPDLWIKQGSHWLGQEVYNDDGTDQTSTRTVPRGKTVVYPARLYNRREESETFWIHGPGSDPDWTVRYYWGTRIDPHREVTSKVTRPRGWKRAHVPPGGSRNFLIAVTPGLNATGDWPVFVTACSDRDPGQLDCIQARTTVPHRQPDLWIKHAGNWLGNDVYNGNGNGQTARQKKQAGRTAQYRVRFYNDGDEAETFFLQGPGGDADWAVEYYQGSKNVTDLMIRPQGWKQAAVPPGGRRAFRLEVTPSSGLAAGSVLKVKVRAESKQDPNQRDVAKAVTKVKGE